MLHDDNEDDEGDKFLTSAEDHHLRRTSAESLTSIDSASISLASLTIEEDATDNATVLLVVPLCLIGVLVANADTSLVITSSQTVASEFNALDSASWLVTSYALAQCASQPLYGKLSNIFGRKNNLLLCYVFFAVGCLLCAIGAEFWHVIVGRVVSGIGGAGMTALVSVIIADLVPARQIAAWRSYVNIAATMGRSLGGPVGGILTDTVGWRWSFLGQVPLTVVSMMLVSWKMPNNVGSANSQGEKSTMKQKLKRIDFAGALTLASTICGLLLTLDLTTKPVSWYVIVGVGVVTVICGTSFCVIELYFSTEPILPLELLTKRAAWTSYLLCGFQQAAQTCTFYSTPIYYQTASGTSVAEAGLHLVPGVVGNALSGISSGFIVSRTGRYKKLTISASIIATTGYSLILSRWTGSTNWFEAQYIFFGGFGMGMIQSTSFVHLAAFFKSEDLAIAGTTLYLAQGVFQLVGIQTSTVLLQASLVPMLDNRLEGLSDKQSIIEQVVSSVKAIRQLPAATKNIVVQAYITSLRFTYGASIVFAVAGLIFGLSMKEGQI